MEFHERAYFSDPLATEFSAKVVRLERVDEKSSRVWLDRTYFYPASGGQPDDRGTIDGFQVSVVGENGDGTVYHLIDGILEIGKIVECSIDIDRRRDHMQQHSGQHLLSGIFLGIGKLSTVGFHMGEAVCTIDLEGGKIEIELIEEVERTVNKIVLENIEIKSRVLAREEYEKEIGPDRKVRSRLPLDVESVRIVEIGDIDSSTCCGTHCRTTGEIGMVKILGTEKVKAGTRVEFICGGRAIDDYSGKHNLLDGLARSFSTEWRELGSIFDKLSRENRDLRRENERIRRELASKMAGKLSEPTGSIGNYDLVRKTFEEGDLASLKEMASKIRENGETIVMFGLKTERPVLVFACSPGLKLDMGELMRESAKVMGAGGGGGKDFAQGGGGDPEKVDAALDEAERFARGVLEK